MLPTVLLISALVLNTRAGPADHTDSSRTAEVIRLARDDRLISPEQSISSVEAFCQR